MKYMLLLGLGVIMSSCSYFQPPTKPVPQSVCDGHADFTKKLLTLP